MSKVVLFDAVGTILKTSPGVVEVYQRYGQRHGSALSIAEIKIRFQDSRRKLFDLETSARQQTAGQLVSSDDIEYELWFQLIRDVFVDVAAPEPLFEELWRFFADPGNWMLFDDSAAVIESLKLAGYMIGIASNFDSRLYEVVSAFEELDCVDFVFCSARIGFRKPDPAFYATVEEEIQQQLSSKLSAPIWMTGDCVENDFWGPRRHGWNAFWLNRKAYQSADADQEVETIGTLKSMVRHLLEEEE